MSKPWRKRLRWGIARVGCAACHVADWHLFPHDPAARDYTKRYDGDRRLFELQVGFNDKAERLDYGASLMTHAMVFTGVDLDDEGKARKWRVENSWGDKNGDKGFMVMTDRWFDEYNFEVVVDRKYVAESLLAILETKPVELPPWHPMGALARSQ